MNLNKIKTILTCFICSIILMGIIYNVFFEIGTVKNIIKDIFIHISAIFSYILNFIKDLSWRKIYFSFGCVILFLECLEFKGIKYKSFNNIVLNFLLLFTILCAFSDFDNFSFKAAFFGLSLYSIVILSPYMRNKDYENESEQDKSTHIERGNAIFGVIVFSLMALILLFTSDLNSNSKEANKTITIEKAKLNESLEVVKDLTAIEKVASKYDKEFKDLGFTIVKEYMSFYDKETKKNFILYSYNRPNYEYIETAPLVKDTELSIVLKQNKLRIIDFNKLTLSLNNKTKNLEITGLVYDKNKFSEEDIASDLDIVMEKIIIPKLKEMSLEMDRKQ
jgi:hypothetical protein